MLVLQISIQLLLWHQCVMYSIWLKQMNELAIFIMTSIPLYFYLFIYLFGFFCGFGVYFLLKWGMTFELSVHSWMCHHAADAAFQKIYAGKQFVVIGLKDAENTTGLSLKHLDFYLYRRVLWQLCSETAARFCEKNRGLSSHIIKDNSASLKSFFEPFTPMWALLRITTRQIIQSKKM